MEEMTDYLSKFRLDGKTAYVVGGLGLIGREVSLAFSVAGARTLVLDVDAGKGQSLINEGQGRGRFLTFRLFDCANMANIDDSFDQVLQDFNSPDVFINCSYPRTADWDNASFKDVSLESFRKNVDIHMNSYGWLAKLAAESMAKADRGGSIIQLGSTYGIVGQDLTVYENTDMHENMIYAAIKGGITNLTRQMASYYGQYNVRVNTLCPGGVKGPVAGQSNKQSSIFINQYNDKTPLKRLGNADEIASTALFLASDAASYITGATIMVDGGWTAV